MAKGSKRVCGDKYVQYYLDGAERISFKKTLARYFQRIKDPSISLHKFNKMTVPERAAYLKANKAVRNVYIDLVLLHYYDENMMIEQKYELLDKMIEYSKTDHFAVQVSACGGFVGIQLWSLFFVDENLMRIDLLRQARRLQEAWQEVVKAKNATYNGPVRDVFAYLGFEERLINLGDTAAK